MKAASRLRIIGTCLLMALSMGHAQAQTRWFTPADSRPFPLQGRAWSEETGRTYQRLPPRAEKVVRKQLWDLSKDCAGLYIEFRTNAPEIWVNIA